MGPALVVAIGAAAVVGGFLLLLSLGSAFGTARLLQTTRRVTVAEAIDLARAAAADARADAPYVRIAGRIDSEEAFPDEHDRPLVFRWSRLQVGTRPGALGSLGLATRGRGWRTVEEVRERVPFAVGEGLDSIAVRDADLAEGLVVVPRQASGDAAEVRDRLGEGVPLGTPVRLRVEQLSAVEHATVLGVPSIGEDGQPCVRAGRGKPLVLTTLEDPEAMRVLAAETPRRPLAVATLLVAGLGLLAVGTAWAAAGVVFRS